MRIFHAIYSFISWYMFYLWFLYWQADFSSYVGDTASPFFYFASINAAHIVEWSWYTTKDMIDSCFTIMVVTAIFYLYSFVDLFISRSKLGRKICA